MQNKARHTLYADCIRKQNSAIEIIINCHRFLFPDSPDKEELKSLIEQNISPYLVKVDSSNSPLQQQITHLQNQETLDSDIQKSIEEKQGFLNQYTQAYENSVQTYQEVQPQLIALKNKKEEFLSPDSKRNEYIYIIDNETAGVICKKAGKKEDCPITFADKTIELKGNQTDAVRVWRNNVIIDKLTIRDNRTDIDTAHRDGIQLIPPPKFQEKTNQAGEKVKVKVADQMAGMILENTTITNCEIFAPKAALQGIFGSDGMCRKLTINNVKVGTQGGHAISIAGVLTECEFTKIVLRQQQDFSSEKLAPIPEIALFPVRIGGNMADDGMIYILDFKPGSGHEYGSFVDKDNKLYRAGSKKAETINVSDYRKIIPERFKVLSCGLSQFDYNTYIYEYSHWTLADFKKTLPTAYKQMKAWINRRFSEYSSGIRKAETKKITINGKLIEIKLSDISSEQKNRKPFGVWDMLDKARKALNKESPEWLNTRLPDLEETAIRSFTMKCIAIRNGTISPLYDLGDYHNALRKAYLHFMLSDADFNKPMIEEPYPKKPTKQPQKPSKAITPKASEVWSKPADAALKAALRVTPSLSVNKNETITLFFDSDSGYNETGIIYKWTIFGYDKIPAGKQKSYTIDTAKLEVKDKHRIFCEVTKNGKMQRIIAYFNVKKEATAKPQQEKLQDITPKDIWSRTTSLKSDLRVTPSQTPNKGQKVKFYFKKTSKYNDGSYTFRWTISGHSELGTGTGKSRTIDTNKLNEGEKYRLVFTVSKKGGETYNGSVNFTVQAAQQAKTTQTTDKTAHATPTKPTKSWGGLAKAIRVTPSPVQQGDKATFSIDTSSFNPDTTTFSYYWSLEKQTSNKATLEVDTTNLTPGEHKLSVTLYTKQKGETKRTPIPGGAMLMVIPKEATTATNTPATTETSTASVKPTQAGRTLGQYIRVTETGVDKGKTVTFSLDPAFIQQESQNAKITYYWSLPGHKAGRKASYVVDTSILDEGVHRVQVGMYKTPTGGTRVVSDGWGTFEVVESQQKPLISTSAVDELTIYAKNVSSSVFTAWLKNIFGSDIPDSAYKGLYTDLIDKQLKNIPIIVGDMQTAYNNGNHRIYINKKHVDLALQEYYEAVWILFHIIYEEFGHHIDYLLRNYYSNVGGDAPQDEGAKFAFILGDIAFSNKNSFTFAAYNDVSVSKSLVVDPMHKVIQTYIERHDFIETDRITGKSEYYGRSKDADYPVCTPNGRESPCIVLPGFVDTSVYIGSPKAGWLQSIAEGNPQYNTTFNPAIIELSEQVKDAFVQEFNDALKAIGSSLESAAYALEIYLKKAFLNILYPITSKMHKELEKYPNLDYASLDYALSLNSILDRLGKLPAAGSVAKLAKVFFKVIGAIAVTYEINVDHYGRVYVGAGGELGLKLGSKGKVHPITEEIGQLDGFSMVYSMSTILNKLDEKSPKDLVYAFLTGLEANASVNLFNLISGGATYAIQPDLYSGDFGIAHDFSELSFIADLSFGFNISICLNK